MAGLCPGRSAAWLRGALQNRDPGFSEVNRDPASAAHDFVMRRARGTRLPKTHIAPVLGCGRVMQPGADGGDTRDMTQN